MSFAKAFGLSLIAFIALNAVFFLIGHALLGTLDSFFDSLATSPYIIRSLLFGPLAGNFPSIIVATITLWIGGFTVEPGSVILLVGYIIAPLIAAILSGRFGENKTQSFGGWFLTAIVSVLIILIWIVIDVGEALTPEGIAVFVVTYIGIGLIYGLMFGSISLLVAKEEY